MKATAYTQSQSYFLFVNKATIERMLTGIPSFSLLYGLGCAFQFTIQDYSREKFGVIPSLLASGFAGGTVWTLGDHLIMRYHRNKSLFNAFRGLNARCIFTGFTPLMIRETIFCANVAYVGPATGQFLKRKLKNSKYSDTTWDILGRLTSGIFLGLISHPLHVLGRTL